MWACSASTATASAWAATRDVYVIDNHFKSGPDSCVAHRTEQAKYNAALVAFIQAAKPDARIVVGGDLNVYPRPDDTLRLTAARATSWVRSTTPAWG